MVANLFGSMERTHYIFRDTLEAVRHLVELKVKPPAALARPWRYRDVPFTALHLLPWKVRSRADPGPPDPTLSQLPQLQSWPDDGGAFVTLPQVYSEDPDHPGVAKSNLGMYRVQYSGNRVRAGPRGRPALPDPSRDRRASRGGDPSRRAAPGQRLPRRSAEPDRRRRDAVARGPARAELRRGPGRPSDPDGSATRSAACRSPPRPTSPSSAPSTPTSASPRGRSATTSAITA